MAIESLSTTAQSIVMLNFDFFAKKLIIAIPLLWSIFYVFYWHKRQKESDFFMVAYLRTVIYVVCNIFIWISPMTIFFLYPQVEIDYVLKLLLIFYAVGFMTVGIVLFINIMFLGPLLVMRLGGLSVEKARMDRIMIILFGKRRSAAIIRGLPKFKLKLKDGKFNHG